MTKVNHVVFASSLAIIFELDPFSALLGSILPDKDICIARFTGTWEGKKRKTLWNAHRGFTHHAILFVPFSAFIVLYFLQESLALYFAASFSLGYISHLTGDILTPLGIPAGLSYKKRIAVPVFRTNSPLEHVFTLAFSVPAGTLVLTSPDRLINVISIYITLISNVFLMFS